MCTAVKYKNYFGRTLDYEFSYGEEICITPRQYNLNFKHLKNNSHHFAFMGMAHIEDNYPLYYDAFNEKGLAIAGLNFVNNACYFKEKKNKINVTQFELIPYLLSNYSTIKEIKNVLKKINITNIPFNDKLPCSPLHWLVSDKNECIVIEQTKSGLYVYDNKIGVLTNNPPFEEQLFNLNNYRHLSTKEKENTFIPNIELNTYSRGLGGIGLPGDLSSMSRFVRVSFVKAHSISNDNEENNVSQFFHILNSVDQQRGCCELENGKYEITIYTSCCSLDKGLYYYTTYDNHQINVINMFKEDLDTNNLIRYPLLDKENFNFQN